MTWPLIYQATGTTLHCPMVHADVNGVRTLLILDTGATDHLLTVDLCRAAGLSLAPAEPGTDAAGATVPSWNVGLVDVTFGDEPLELADVIAIDGPEPFGRWGVGGILSPQRLAAGSTVVLDLVTGQLDVTADERGAPEAIGAAHPSLTPIAVDRHAAGTLGLDAVVGPAGHVVALLDTGAPGTEVVWHGLTDGATSSGRGVSGREITASELADQAVHVGGTSLAVARLGIRTDFPVPDGAAPGEVPTALIGMDLLAGTVLVIPPVPAPVVWLVPGSDPK